MADADKKKKYECHKCEKKFSSKILLEKHLKRKYPCDETDNKCKKCGKTFATKGSLKRHHELRCSSFTCKVCNAQFQNKLKYDSHLKTCVMEEIHEMKIKIDEIFKYLIINQKNS
jgi:DNA-directed RNA polymerase subunit RPC12/RpoP